MNLQSEIQDHNMYGRENKCCDGMDKVVGQCWLGFCYFTKMTTSLFELMACINVYFLLCYTKTKQGYPSPLSTHQSNPKQYKY